jgi:streptogramin lyase
MKTQGARFTLGQVVLTPAAIAALSRAATNAATLLDRHVSGDWGNVPPEDAKENEFSLEHGFRIMSSYAVGSETVWVLTQATRAYTTLLTPQEY